MNNTDNNTGKAIFFIILSSFWFSVMQVCVKFSGKNIPLMEQIFFRNLITFFITFFVIFKKKESFFGKRENRKYLFLRAFFGYTGVCCFFYATNHMTLSDASILQKSSPIYITIFSAILARKALDRNKTLCVIIAFIGAMFVVRPQFDSQTFPALIAMLSAILTAISHMALSYANKFEKPYTIVFFFSLFSTVCSFPFVVMNFVMPNIYEILLLIGIGVFAGLGQTCLTMGYRYSPASKVSIYTYTSVIFAAILSIIFFNQNIGLYSFIGIVLVFISSYYDYRLVQKHE
ncbi:MAG: DMT family transporter [Peptoanaerobacter stomatis]|uniref:DMT family transporter n=1 Tax=Peptoanaerobacter stomatis TaxID=796937 RepID=UPI003FA05355